MNDSVFIAAHHYQNKNIVARADLVADSYRLAVEAAKSDASFIVVCGVRFMAESAAALARKEQMVLHPAPDAGCPMADMVDLEKAERALRSIKELSGKDPLPVTYMNSSLSVKALTGRLGGSICTSGNAKKILSWALQSGRPVLFMPDANLGYNTAFSLGVPIGETALITKDGKIQANSGQPRVFMWDGFCPIHKVFSVQDIAKAREAFPGIQVTVHPECLPEVVQAADLSGSTEGMYQQLKDAPEGSTWAVGTELHFVERMASLFPSKTILPLRHSACTNMVRVTETRLDATLEAIRAFKETGAPLHAVLVSDDEREYASQALKTMVRLTDA